MLAKKGLIIVKNILFDAYYGIDAAVIPEGTVKSRLSKARKLLKEVLGRESDLQF